MDFIASLARRKNQRAPGKHRFDPEKHVDGQFSVLDGKSRDGSYVYWVSSVITNISKLISKVISTKTLSLSIGERR